MQSEDLSGLLATLRSLDTDTSTIEAKRARGGLPAKMWETLSAFSNAQGGVILFGVDEKSGFSVTGVEDPGSMELSLAKICSDSMEPPVRPLIQTFSIEGEKVLVAEIPAMSAGQKPCFYRGQGCYGGSYIRVGDNDRKLTDYEVNLLLSGRGQPKDDERVVEEASIDDLDQDIYQQFVAGQRRQRPRAFQGRSDEQLLSMMKVVKIQDGRPVPTVAGLLAMGTYPQEFFPQLNLTFVVYPSTQMGAPGSHGERFLDNASLDGPISEMVSSALLRLQRNMRRRSIISGIARQDVWEYPETALREAVVNSLAHRDLSQGSLGTPAQIEMYPDRLVIRNPGGLFGPVNVADLPTSHVSSARNQALLKLMEFVQLPDGGSVCEARGSGISSMIYALRAAGMGIPEFEDNVSSFSVTFPNASLLDEETVKWLGSLGETGLTESQILALARMRNGESLNNNSYRSHLGVDSRVATTELRDLVDRGVAEQSGTRRWATYTLASSRDSRKGADQLSLGDSDAASGSLPAPVAEIVGVVHDELASRILALLGSRGPLTRKEIEEELGSATHNVLYRLRELKNRGRVEQIGAARSPKVRWRIKE